MKKTDRGRGVCSGCGEEAVFRAEDCGIGGYEYWGSRGTHHDWQWISFCCSEAPKGEVEELGEGE